MSTETSSATGSAARGKELLQYGGQAVIEGVMMRSPHYFAVACRTPDGRIVVQREAVDRSIIGKLKWLNRPFLRGTLALIDAMALGTRALRFSSDVQLKAESAQTTPVRPGPEVHASANQAAITSSHSDKASSNGSSAKGASPDTNAHRREVKEELLASAASAVNGVPMAETTAMPKSGKMNDIAVGGTLLLSLVSGLVLFKFIPTWATDRFQHWGFLGKHSGDHALNAMDGLIRMVIFFGYILLISQMSQIKRVFMYHGAEHKAINTLEAGLPLKAETALRASRIHPRCGTSFIFIVLLIDLIVIALLPYRPILPLRFLLQVAVTPIVAGIAYEVIKFAGNYRGNPFVMAVLAPGMATQYLTTREPDAGQTEVALAALYSVLTAEGHVISPDGLLQGAVAPDAEEPAVATA